MPAYLDRAEFRIDTRFACGYNIWFGAESEGVLQCEFALEQFILALFLALGPFIVPTKGQDVASSTKDVPGTHKYTPNLERLL